MARYRTKPFEIEAVQFNGENFDDILDFVGYRLSDKHPVPNFAAAGEYRFWEDSSIVAEVYDHLHSTWVGVKAGQYIIKGSKGEFYPCDPDVFHDKYEELDDTVDHLGDGSVELASGGMIEPANNDQYTVNIIMNTCADPERVASEVINRIRKDRRGGRPAR